MPSTCPQRDQWLALSHGHLPEQELEALGQHLEGCAACAQLLASLDVESDELLADLSELGSGLEGEAQSLPEDLLAAARRVIETGLSETAHGLAKALDQGPPHPLRLGNFELKRSLGAGSFGHVFLAEDSSLQREVAIKVQRFGLSIDGEQEQRFLREARSAARLQHPSIVGLYETGHTKSGVRYLVCEFISGETLAQKLEHGPLEPKAAVAMVSTIARALSYAHAQGIVHRDVKPSNILLDQKGLPHLADFGLATGEQSDETLTPLGEVMGTPAYLSPEMAAGEAHRVDGRSDVYSLGVILYEALTGERPFQGKGHALLKRVLEEDAPSPRKLLPQLERDLETVCLKALQKAPSARYQSALELAEDLERYQEGSPVLARPRAVFVRVWRWGLREPLAASLILAACLGSLVSFAHMFDVSRSLVQSAALDSAAQYADMLEVVNEVYSQEVVDRLGHHAVEVTADYAQSEDSIPLPATLLTVLLGRIEDRGSGMSGRHYSDFPFNFRRDGGPDDDFEADALTSLNANPEDPYYRFTEDADGIPVLRYTRARVMGASCVKCHNEHPDSPKRDWEVGDVRGVLEVVRCLDRDEDRIRANLRSTFSLIGVGALLMLSLGMGAHFLTQQKRQRALESERR